MNGESIKSLPDGAVVSWYGDDFTGSAAVMEVLTFAGLPSVLFLDLPTPEQLARFAGYRGIGIAGRARSMTPEWMDEDLPACFRALERIGAPIAHYKVCSTFDSAPNLGSIGRAVDLAAPILGGSWHPLIVAAPPIARYQAFGNLFAGFGDATFRLDRHPTMSRHPATPMAESDVREHLSKQTAKTIGLIDVLALGSGNAPDALRLQTQGGAEIIAIDAIDERDLSAAGRLIWESCKDRLLAIGSQGVEYALTACWREAGLIEEPKRRSAGAADRIAVVSGSCAPQTAMQIARAAQTGFQLIRLDPRRAVEERAWRREIERVVEAATTALGSGHDPLVYTAMGPEDQAIGSFREAAASSGVPLPELNARVGAGLGRTLDLILRKTGIKRGVIAGGDTSSHGAAVLGIGALTALAPIAPGAALFKAHFDDPAHRDLEIALKGGQMGGANYFQQIKQGGVETSQ